mmetsp:Transcript_10329/g.23896  ORF Transcript_10329/g.23896 Transcript_10329/m.23896 type:complete len:147 (-) Transcript_10329:1466-1906(-)
MSPWIDGTFTASNDHTENRSTMPPRQIGKISCLLFQHGKQQLHDTVQGTAIKCALPSEKILQTSVGTEPVTPVSFNNSTSNDSKPPNSVGIIPCMPGLSDSASTTSIPNWPSSEGRKPAKELFVIEMTSIDPRFPNSVGIVPVNPL